MPRATATCELPEMLEIYAHTVESIVNDGERSGILEPPETPEMFVFMVESVVNGEMSAFEAMAHCAVELSRSRR